MRRSASDDLVSGSLRLIVGVTFNLGRTVP